MEYDELARPRNVQTDFDDDETEDELEDDFADEDDSQLPVKEAPDESCSDRST
jgi:hypothetical protein